eukprot:gene35156-43342_t
MLLWQHIQCQPHASLAKSSACSGPGFRAGRSVKESDALPGCRRGRRSRSALDFEHLRDGFLRRGAPE